MKTRRYDSGEATADVADLQDKANAKINELKDVLNELHQQARKHEVACYREIDVHGLQNDPSGDIRWYTEIMIQASVLKKSIRYIR